MMYGSVGDRTPSDGDRSGGWAAVWDGRALLTAVPLALLVFVLVAPTGDARFFAPPVLRLVLAAGLVLRLAFAAWGLRAHLATGATAPLALAVGLFGFTGMFVWNFVLATPQRPFTYAAYGALARTVFAVAMLNMVGFGTVADRGVRRRLVTLGVGIAAGLCLLGGALGAPIYRLAESAPEERLRLLRLLFEGAALLLELGAAARVVRLRAALGRRTALPLLAGILLAGEQSLFLLTGAPWTVRWWLGHLTGVAAAAILGWAVVAASARGREP